MFFRYFTHNKEISSRWLFFNRNRAVVDYKKTTTNASPQFGFTEAISYNWPKLKGVAPVAVVQVVNNGVFPKAGIQYALAKKDLTLFSWVVCETSKEPGIDIFLLCRYTPGLGDKLDLFVQVETLNAFPTGTTEPYTLTQRVRMGLQIKDWQFGPGIDLRESQDNTPLASTNIGAFLRHEF